MKNGLAENMIELIDSSTNDHVVFSFEYFVPKTQGGRDNLLLRIDRMADMQPAFVDITYNPKTAEKTLQLCSDVLKYCGVDVMMHLTCTDMDKEGLKQLLNRAKENGLRNILALRGDSQDRSKPWEPSQGGLQCAQDLVRLIREEHGDYFAIAVAGYPESHSGSGCRSTDYYRDIEYLKEKVDAGAQLVIAQMFYQTSYFLHFVDDCRAAGIEVPILPAIMPIQNYRDFHSMVSYIRCKVPQQVLDAIEPIKGDDAAVKAYGVEYAIQMCNELIKGGCKAIHFHTLNLERSVRKVIDGLHVDTHRRLPWRPSAHAKRENEEVRPIFWANRPKSYLDRTQDWDDFPNGRWGDSASPAFGGMPDIHFYQKQIGSDLERKAEWGENPQGDDEIYEVFARYVEGKVSSLPWCESGLHLETNLITARLAAINRQGFMTINSQPRVNGIPSSDAKFGWGPRGGYVYQKAYIEFFCSAELLNHLEETIRGNQDKYAGLVYNAVDVNGDHRTNVAKGDRYVCAVTWGVFPGREIVQPTIVDHDSFMVWKDEAFDLWLSGWASIYNEDSTAYEVIFDLHDSVYLVNVVDNDYVNGDIFEVFDDVIRNGV